jgi:hypothetical protein
MLNLLLGHHLKAHEFGDAEGGRHGDVGSVAAASPGRIWPSSHKPAGWVVKLRQA